MSDTTRRMTRGIEGIDRSNVGRGRQAAKRNVIDPERGREPPQLRDVAGLRGGREGGGGGPKNSNEDDCRDWWRVVASSCGDRHRISQRTSEPTNQSSQSISRLVGQAEKQANRRARKSRFKRGRV